MLQVMSVRPEQVAIVDDDEAVRRALARLVRTLGFEAATFASAEDFIASLPAIRPRWVLLDLHLPGMRGLEALEALRALVRSIRVLIMTGHDEPGMRQRCLDAGAAGYLTKPIDLTLVERLLADERSTDGTNRL
jgi:FixJ family two-component response regulator